MPLCFLFAPSGKHDEYQSECLLPNADQTNNHMNVITPRRTSRREWIRNSAAATLALGLWPGCARFGGNGRGGEFTFIQVNDSHFSSPKCPEFFERVTISVRAHKPKPELCLMVGDLADRGTE